MSKKQNKTAAQNKEAMEKTAAEQADAFDLGVQVAMREMGVVEKNAQEQFLGYAQKVAHYELSQG